MTKQHGNSSAPRPTDGAFTSGSQPTQFLPDLPTTSWHARFYIADRMRIAGTPILRWGYGFLVGVAVIWLLAGLPGSWGVAMLWLAGALALAGAAYIARRAQYVDFTATASQLPTGVLLPTAAKIPVYVTGLLGVERKERAFTMAPGFYRTFATREHALLCRVNERHLWGVATWPEEETGLWYAFFAPQQIVDIAAGCLRYGHHTFDALAVTYRPAPSNSKHRRTPGVATLYLGFPDSAGCTTVVADLAVEWNPAVQWTDRL